MRAVSLLALVGLLASGAARAQDPAQVLSVAERQPLAFVLGTPTGELGRTSRSELIRIVSDLLRRHTNLELEALDSSVLEECEGRLGCITLKARRDYERSALIDANARPVPYREHMRQMRESKRRYSRYLLIVSNVTVSGQADRLSVSLLNTDLALNYLHEASREAPDWQDVVEAKIESAAVVVPTVRAKTEGPAEAETFLTRLFEESFRGPFEATGQWSPYGTIELRTSVDNAMVFLDERPVGSTQAGLTRIEKVDPGLHALRLEHPSFEPFSQQVEVRRMQSIEVQANPAARLAVVSDVPRTLTLWGGVAIAAAGVGLSIYGATRPDSSLSVACFEGSPDCTGGRRFITFGYDSSKADRDPAGINPKGVMIVPLGYSLVGTGAAFSVGALLSEPSEVPWLTWLTGVVVGAAAYGISAAVGGP